MGREEVEVEDSLGHAWSWEEVPRALALRRKQLGLSQYALAGIMGLTQSTVATHELGRKGIGINALARWTRALKVVLDLEIVDGVIAVKLTEGRKRHGARQTPHGLGRHPEDQAEAEPA